MDAHFEIDPLLANDAARRGDVGIVDLEIDLRHLVVGVRLVAETEDAVEVDAGDPAEGITAKAILLVSPATDSEEEARVAVDLVVVTELDDEVSILIAQVMESVLFEERLDHGVAE